MPSRTVARAAAPAVRLEDHARLELKLTIKDREYAVYGSNVKQLTLRLTTYGLAGTVGFWMVNDDGYGGAQKDELYEAAITDEPITIELGIASFRINEEDTTKAAAPLKLKALVRERTITEQPYAGTDRPEVLARYYVLGFADTAEVLWRQHFPCALYTDKALKDVIDANKHEQIQVTCEGEPLTAKRPLVFLNLDPSYKDGASFYDYLVWLCDTQDWFFSYGYKDQKYRLGTELPKPAEPLLLARMDVGRIAVSYSEVPRRQTRVLNAATADPRTQPTKLPTGLDPMAQDFLVRTPISADFDTRTKLEEQRLRVRSPSIQLELQRLPLRMFGPWDLIDLSKTKAWDAADIALPALAQKGKLRVVELSLQLDARELDLQAREGGTIGAYTGRLSAVLVPEAERGPHLPEYVTPRYPAKVESTVVSEIGEEAEETYDVVTDDKTSLRSYKLKLPLFADQIVRAPFEPLGMNGHFYYPFYKGERVLCALSHESAAVVGCLDWRAGASVPLETQGNQLFMGKTLESCVSVSMLYEEDVPAYTLQRVHKKDDEDVQTVQIKEGVITVFVGHGKDGKAADKILTMSLALDKKGGASLKLENPDKKTTQTVTLDGTALTMTVKGEEDTSTYTQVADTITIQAKHIKLTGETITATSTKESSWTSDDTLTLKSKKDMTQHSEAAWSAKADKDADLKGDNVTVAATKTGTLKGKDVTVSGSASLTGKSPQTTLSGDTSVKVKGASIGVKASASLTCESGASATLKGSLVTISGSLIKVG